MSCMRSHRDFSRLRKENIYENNKLAFQVAEEQLGIPALLEAEDMVALKVPDRLSILTYVSQYYNYFHGRSPIGGMAGVKRPPSDSGEEPIGKKVISQPAVKPASPAPVQPLSPVRTNPIVQGKNTVMEFSPAKPGRVSTGSESPRGSRSSICAICKKHVHLVQRYLVDGKLYHRNCFRCKQCSNTLHSGAYKSTGEPGVFVCTNHHTKASIPHSKSPSTDRKQPGYSSQTNPVPMDTTSPGTSRRTWEPDKPREAGQKTNPPGREPVSNSTPKGFVQSAGWSPSSVGNGVTSSPSPISPVLRKSSSFLNRFTQNSSPAGGKPGGVTNSSPVGWSSAQGKSDPPTTSAPSKLDFHMTSSQGKSSLSGAPPSPRTSPRSRSDTQVASQSIPSQIKSDFRAAPQIQLNSSPAASQPKVDSSTNSWTSSVSKTQQAREKFFQSSGASADKPPAPKEYGLTFTSSQAAEKTPSGVTGAPALSTRDSMKDKARNFLVKNLMIGQEGTAAQHPSRSSPTPSRALTPDPKTEGPRGTAKTKPETASSLSGIVTEFSSKGKVSASASPQRARKSPSFSRPGNEIINARPKPDTLVVNGQGSSPTADPLNGPASWRSRLKPVEKISSADRVPEPKEKAAPVETKGLAIPKKPLENSSAASTALPEGRKKLSIPSNLDISDTWMKSEQKWEEPIPPEKPSRLNKPEKPYNPISFSISSKKEVTSPVKLHPDYVSEEEIQKKIQDIERELDSLELKGIDLERKLREAEGDDSEDALMVEWFKLIHEKQLLLRQESELMYKAKEQRLEEMQFDIEGELRRLVEKPESLKTPREKKREQELLDQYVNLVNDRSDIVDCLDEDRIREQEEDQVIQDMIQKLDLQKDGTEKKKPKSRFPKIWKQKNKGKSSE
ncbi:MICAL-like protein 2 isoform X2 [Dromiciops gliroides]|uniref:MICAL-like protein 2 isoform X2 n=1 Tax=Dromiciops gliroides TaxID=33562 RepID=UPI001CC7BDC7|nr:MICAL-like protein 2 isoform X2 [Dromiciops gliroides]